MNVSRQEVSVLGVHLLIKHLKQQDHFRRANIGAAELINEKGAMILEVTSIEVTMQLKDLISEAIVISQTELLILTAASQTEWQTKLTRLWQEDPGMCAVQLRWRRCSQNGRPWAKPQMLDNIVRAAARGARPGDGGADERIGQITVQGPLGAHPEQVLTKQVEAIEQRATQAGRPLQDYQWNLQLAEDGRPTGRIKLRLPSLAELERVRHQIQEDIIEVNGTFLPIRMHTEALVRAPFRK